MPNAVALREREDAFERFSRAVELPLTIIGILWLPVLVIPLVVHTHGSVAASLDLIDYAVWAVFLFEYLVKVLLAPDRWHFIRTHLLDLVIVVIPLFRPLRLLRSIRSITVLLRSTTRIRAMLSHHGLHFVLLTIAMSVFAGAGLELSFESQIRNSNIHSYGEALWWAMTTVSTVGYGDHFPVSAGGRGVALVLILVGVASIGLVTASIASFFVEEKANPLELDIAAMREELTRIRDLLVRLAPAAEDVESSHALHKELASDVAVEGDFG